MQFKLDCEDLHSTWGMGKRRKIYYQLCRGGEAIGQRVMEKTVLGECKVAWQGGGQLFLKFALE